MCLKVDYQLNFLISINSTHYYISLEFILNSSLHVYHSLQHFFVSLSFLFIELFWNGVSSCFTTDCTIIPFLIFKISLFWYFFIVFYLYVPECLLWLTLTTWILLSLSDLFLIVPTRTLLKWVVSTYSVLLPRTSSEWFSPFELPGFRLSYLPFLVVSVLTGLSSPVTKS